MNLVFVLWDGTPGGAESLSVELARRAAELGHRATVVFIKDGAPLSARADQYGVPTVSLGLGRAVRIVTRPRAYAAAIAALDPDLVVSMSVNRLAWALRAGGYRGPLAAVEHGELMRHQQRPLPVRAVRMLDRAIAGRLCTEVAVSEFMRERTPHPSRVVTVENGVDPVRFQPGDRLPPRSPVRFGFAGRLIPGKGVARIIDAYSRLAPHVAVELRIAGDGPLAASLRQHAAGSSAPDGIAFLGTLTDMAAFWRTVDVCVAASDTVTESFGMSVLEAMATGCPAIVTRNGGLAELVQDAVSGSVVAPGDTDALERAMADYCDPARITTAGHAARRRAVDRYSLDRCLDGYLALAGRR